MYGIVNKAIEELVCTHHGADTWARIKERSGVAADFFISDASYPDTITFQLAQATAEELQQPLAEVLRLFGHFWVLHTGKQKYGALMEAGGANLRDFLLALPQFHNRILLMFPQLRPPEFVVQELDATSLSVQYYSEREGLEPFVQGLLEGLALLFRTEATVQQQQSRTHLDEPAIFVVTYNCHAA